MLATNVAASQGTRFGLDQLEERRRQLRRHLEELPVFPDGAAEWKDFIAPYQSVVTEIPFAITFVEVPDSAEAFCSSKMSDHEAIIFGVLIARNDGKLGQLCFGVVPSDLVDSNPQTLSSFLTHEDGLDVNLLRVGAKGPYRKVLSMDVGPESVISRLSMLLSSWAGDEKKIPDGHSAGILHGLQKYTEDLLKVCNLSAEKKEVDPILEKIRARVARRVAQVEHERSGAIQVAYSCDLELRRLAS